MPTPDEAEELRRMDLRVADADSMMKFGAECARLTPPGSLVLLNGELGTGKTTFARGFIRHLGWQQRIKSPSFSLLESYALEQFSLYHLDLYRIQGPEELEYLGLREYINTRDILLVEWPEKAQGFFHPAQWTVSLQYEQQQRRVSLLAGPSIVKRWPNWRQAFAEWCLHQI